MLITKKEDVYYMCNLAFQLFKVPVYLVDLTTRPC